MRALVLAGGFPQIALINELKTRGIFVILADYFENPVARPYADKFFQISTLDIDKIEELSRLEKVDFLITVCTDQALLTVAIVSERLGLPCYINSKQALNVTNKEYMKKIFAERGIPSAKYVILSEYKKKSLDGLRFPLIVKPVNCNSSKGVRKVHNKFDLQVALTDAINLSRTKTAIVEEFIRGIELSVDAYVEDGIVKILAISESEKIKDENKFLIFRGNYPTSKQAIVEAKIIEIIQNIAESFGLDNCPMLVQMLCENEEINVVEFSARTGGGAKYIMIAKASGFDVIKAVVDLTLGIKPRVGEVIEENKFISNVFLYCKPGVFDHLEGFEELKSNGIISDYYLFKSKHAVINDISSSGDRLCGFTIQADEKELLQNKYLNVISSIQVIDTEGNDMLCHKLLIP